MEVLVQISISIGGGLVKTVLYKVKFWGFRIKVHKSIIVMGGFKPEFARLY